VLGLTVRRCGDRGWTELETLLREAARSFSVALKPRWPRKRPASAAGTTAWIT
jgi:hypothetical protein